MSQSIRQTPKDRCETRVAVGSIDVMYTCFVNRHDTVPIPFCAPFKTTRKHFVHHSKQRELHAFCFLLDDQGRRVVGFLAKKRTPCVFVSLLRSLVLELLDR